MPLQFLGKAPGFRGWKGLIQGPGSMRIEVIGDQADLLRLREVLLHQLAQLHGEAVRRAIGRDRDAPPAEQGGTQQEEIALPAR